MKRQEDDANWNRTVSEPRLAITDVHARGIGLRRLQLIVRSSFDDNNAWEVRQLGYEWFLYSSQVVEDSFETRLVGYKRVNIDPELLSSFYQRIVSLSLPLAGIIEGVFGLGGTLFEIALFGDGFPECRFHWWSEPPASWLPLDDIVSEIINIFSAAEEGRA